MSAAINQVVQNLHARLMRVDSVGLAILATAIPPLARGAHQQQSRSNSWWRPLVAALPTHPPVAAFSTHLATPRAISTPIRSRQCYSAVQGTGYSTGYSTNRSTGAVQYSTDQYLFKFTRL